MYAFLNKDAPFNWSKACEKSFKRLKSEKSLPIMQPLNWNLPFELMCDANDYAIGTVLGQRRDKKSVIFYASHTLNDAQMNYTTTKKSY